MEQFHERRKQYYIKKGFQRNFILKFCILVLIGSLISGIIIYVMSKATVTTTFENSKLTIKSTADFILPAVLLSSAVVIVVIGLATILITLYTSHKIAGPLYRLERDINEITSGNLKIRFNLRHTDEIKPLAANLDMMAQGLRDRALEIKNTFSELESATKASGANMPKDIKDRLERLKDAIEKLST